MFGKINKKTNGLKAATSPVSTCRSKFAKLAKMCFLVWHARLYLPSWKKSLHYVAHISQYFLTTRADATCLGFVHKILTLFKALLLTLRKPEEENKLASIATELVKIPDV